MSFNIDGVKRLRELAGIEQPPKDAGHLEDFEREADADDQGADEPESEHLDKEESVFRGAHDALEELLSFLHSQEGFEEKRGKEGEYSEMEQNAESLLQTMKKHLEGYDDNDEVDDDSDNDEEMSGHDDDELPKGGQLSDKWKQVAGLADEQEEWGVHHTGQNTDQSVATLRKQASAAKKRGDTTEVRQKDFAIRAKTGWGKVN